MTIWVGEIEGKPLVYDPAIQLPDCPHIFLWDPASGEMDKRIANLTRQRIKPHRNSNEVATNIALYQKWYTQHGVTWLEAETQHYASRAIREAELKQKQIKKQLERTERKTREEMVAAQDPLIPNRMRLKIVEDQRIARLVPAKRHEATLRSLGKAYLGVRQATSDPGKNRITHCYKCHDTLDNSIDLECISCSWIICRCGACRCGY